MGPTRVREGLSTLEAREAEGIHILPEAVERLGLRLTAAKVQDCIDDGRPRERPDGTRNARNQRPALWNLYNTRHLPGQHVRVFPLSNWTELDVWRHIEREPLERRVVRYRTVGDASCSGAVESPAATVAEVIAEVAADQMGISAPREGRDGYVSI